VIRKKEVLLAFFKVKRYSLTSLLICFHGLKLFQLLLTLFFFAPTQSAEEGKRKKERVNTTDQHRAKKIEVMVVQISKRVQFGVGLFFEFR